MFTSVGSRLEKAYLDGKVAALDEEMEHGHPVFSTMLDLAAGATRTLEVRLAEPVSAGRAGRAGAADGQAAADRITTGITAGDRSCS